MLAYFELALWISSFPMGLYFALRRKYDLLAACVLLFLMLIPAVLLNLYPDTWSRHWMVPIG